MNIQILLVAVLLSASVGAAAKERDSSDNKIRTWNATNEFHTVEVSDNVNIILAEDAGNTISIQEKQNMLMPYVLKSGMEFCTSPAAGSPLKAKPLYTSP